MDADNNIWNELRTVTPTIAGIKNSNIFWVPDGYFDDLTANILIAIKKEEHNLSQSMPFTVPAGYFEGLADQVLNTVKLNTSTRGEVWNELQSIAPLLNTIDKAPVLSLPEGYFDNLQITPAKEEKAKIISFARAGKLIKYAAVAVIIGVIAITSALFLRESMPVKDIGIASYQIQQELKSLPDTEIMEELNTYNSAADLITADEPGTEDEPADLMSGVSMNEMVEFLNENEEPGEPHS